MLFLKKIGIFIIVQIIFCYIVINMVLSVFDFFDMYYIFFWVYFLFDFIILPIFSIIISKRLKIPYITVFVFNNLFLLYLDPVLGIDTQGIDAIINFIKTLKANEDFTPLIIKLLISNLIIWLGSFIYNNKTGGKHLS